MANDGDVALLNEGVDAWNRWRAENRIRPDLSGAMLVGMYLSGANLCDARLRKVDLSSANLARGS